MSVESISESNVRQVVPLLWVRDMDRSSRFYVDGLGFTMTRRWIQEDRLRWCWLELGHAALMLQEFWAEGQHANVPEGKVGVGISLNFVCEDALRIYVDLRSRGVSVTTPFVGNGMWVTQVSDPDGYSLAFESSTAEPEETVYSDLK